MSLEIEAREFALLAPHQFLVKNASTLRITRESLSARWPTELWHQSRIATIEVAFKVYFARVWREDYIGRQEFLGYDGLEVSGLRRTSKRRALRNTGNFCTLHKAIS